MVRSVNRTLSSSRVGPLLVLLVLAAVQTAAAEDPATCEPECPPPAEPQQASPSDNSTSEEPEEEPVLSYTLYPLPGAPVKAEVGFGGAHATSPYLLANVQTGQQEPSCSFIGVDVSNPQVAIYPVILGIAHVNPNCIPFLNGP